MRRKNKVSKTRKNKTTKKTTKKIGGSANNDRNVKKPNANATVSERNNESEERNSESEETNEANKKAIDIINGNGKKKK